jgi:nicotinamidase-related amidase
MKNPAAARLTCEASQSQVVVIDIQTKLGEVMPAKVLNRVVENTRLLLTAAHKLAIPVLATQQYPAGLGSTVPDIAQRLPDNTGRFEKTCFACTGVDEFLEQLQCNARPQVILTGMEAHVCVLQTAMDLHQRGYQVFAVGDAICSRRLENYQNALERMHQCGVVVTGAESVVFEWLGDARHEHFKEIVAMMR